MRAIVFSALVLMTGGALAQTDDMTTDDMTTDDMAELTGEDMVLANGSDLLELCSAQETDVEGLQALSFCYGFIEGIYVMHEAMAATEEGVRLVCPPDDATRDTASDAFVAWASANPDSLDEPPHDVLFRAWTETYPCPASE